MDYRADARATLARLADVISALGLRRLDLDDNVLGCGLALAWADDLFLTVTVPASSPTSAYISAGVLRGVDEHMLALELCNDRNHLNPAMPFFLHDAEAGADILMQQSYPAQVLVDVPPFFGACLEPAMQVIATARESFAEAGLAGEPYSWAAGDGGRLLTRSFL